MGKRSILIAAALAALLAASPPAYAYAQDAARSSPFSDVRTEDWFAGAVMEGRDRGIIDGYTDGTFRPQRKLSYGEFIKMAVSGRKVGGSGTHWASGCYNYALQKGYLTERDITQRLLDDGIPRKHMALIFANILAAKGYAEGEVASAPFSDVGSLDRYEYQIAVCVKAGVLSGYKDGSFRPDAVLTRAEAASALVRFFRLLEAPSLGEGPAAEAPNSEKPSAIDVSQDVEIAYPDDPKLYVNNAAQAPSDAADSEMRTMLDQILASMRIGETDGGCTLYYDKPEIPSELHFSMRITGGGDGFYYQSDAGYRSDPSLYDPSAGSFEAPLPGTLAADAGCTLLLSLSRTDGGKAVSYRLQDFGSEETRLFLIFHNGGRSSRHELPLPDSLLGR